MQNARRHNKQIVTTSVWPPLSKDRWIYGSASLGDLPCSRHKVYDAKLKARQKGEQCWWSFELCSLQGGSRTSSFWFPGRSVGAGDVSMCCELVRYTTSDILSHPFRINPDKNPIVLRIVPINLCSHDIYYHLLMKTSFTSVGEHWTSCHLFFLTMKENQASYFHNYWLLVSSLRSLWCKRWFRDFLALSIVCKGDLSRNPCKLHPQYEQKTSCGGATGCPWRQYT